VSLPRHTQANPHLCGFEVEATWAWDLASLRYLCLALETKLQGTYEHSEYNCWFCTQYARYCTWAAFDILRWHLYSWQPAETKEFHSYSTTGTYTHHCYCSAQWSSVKPPPHGQRCRALSAHDLWRVAAVWPGLASARRRKEHSSLSFRENIQLKRRYAMFNITLCTHGDTWLQIYITHGYTRFIISLCRLNCTHSFPLPCGHRDVCKSPQWSFASIT